MVIYVRIGVWVARGWMMICSVNGVRNLQWCRRGVRRVVDRALGESVVQAFGGRVAGCTQAKWGREAWPEIGWMVVSTQCVAHNLRSARRWLRSAQVFICGLEGRLPAELPVRVRGCRMRSYVGRLTGRLVPKIQGRKHG